MLLFGPEDQAVRQDFRQSDVLAYGLSDRQDPIRSALVELGPLIDPGRGAEGGPEAGDDEHATQDQGKTGENRGDNATDRARTFLLMQVGQDGVHEVGRELGLIRALADCGLLMQYKELFCESHAADTPACVWGECDGLGEFGFGTFE